MAGFNFGDTNENFCPQHFPLLRMPTTPKLGIFSRLAKTTLIELVFSPKIEKNILEYFRLTELALRAETCVNCWPRLRGCRFDTSEGGTP